MSQPYYIILNAGSGHEETALRRSTIEDVLNGAGQRFELTVVDDPEELPALAQRAVDRARANGGSVVPAGGDGTINAVAHKAVGSGCPFGVLPQGTFNYFGRTHGIPEDLGDAVRALLDAEVQAVQVGVVNGRTFLVNASIGLYPKLLEERESDKATYGRSRLVAFLSALKTLIGWRTRLRIFLEKDGKSIALHTSTLFIGNNRLQMEQVGLSPMMDAVEDGKLAAIAPQRAGRFAMLGLLLRGAFGRLNAADDLFAFSFKQLTVRRPRIYVRRRIKVATDGEVVKMRTPLEFSVLEGQLLLLKPKTSSSLP